MDFEKELKALINKASKENESNTPDFILAKFIIGCLENYTGATKARDRWFGYNPWDSTNTRIVKAEGGEMKKEEDFVNELMNTPSLKGTIGDIEEICVEWQDMVKARDFTIRKAEYQKIIDALEDDTAKLMEYGMKHKISGIIRAIIIIKELRSEIEEEK